MAISYFLVTKLTPNDLVSIMNGIYPFPINRGHWSLVFDKKNSQVSSVFKRRSVSLLFIFKAFSIGIRALVLGSWLNILREILYC